MSAQERHKPIQGFTLVEILIVVVILGILAAIIIPQFGNASQSSRVSSLQTQLQTLRSQLQVFQVQHNSVYPTLDSTWAIMLNSSGSNETGPGAGTGTAYFPYLRAAPQNPLVSSAVSTAVNAAWDGVTPPSTPAKSETVGWYYQASTGSIAAAGFDETTGQFIP
jgi:general secretion pathway protein G